jgi:glutathione-regulated potassium-efflux system ancillary protein KefC
MLDVAWIALAFALGLLARQTGLPPLVGYLVAGFLLHGFGVRANAVIVQFSDMGVTLLLFTIGLKLKLASLARPQVWAVAGVHMLGTLALLLPVLLGLGVLGVPLVSELNTGPAALIAFALSFSSTVFAVKVLEDKGETAAVYGTVAIGILIVQDLAAVAFLAVTAGKVPSPWAVLLLALVPLRFPIYKLLERAGHGELLVLFGLALGLGGAQLFDVVSIKGDLGALILGVLIAPHPKAGELAKALLGFKDVFLVGFFLSIGLSGAPSFEVLAVGALLMLAVPLKGWFFYRLLALFRLRARTAFLGALSLASFSEFGLILDAIAVTHGWLGEEWLTTIAVAVSLSFVAAAPLNSASHQLYERFSATLCRTERRRRLPDEAEIDPGDADVIILGMGRVGTGAYDTLKLQRGRRPVGIDADPDVVAQHQAAGRNVIQGSATDADFWHRLRLNNGSIRLVLLSLARLSENVFAAEHLIKEGFDGLIGAIAKFPDDEAVLEKAGVQMVFNLYAEAGAGFAQHVCARMT